MPVQKPQQAYWEGRGGHVVADETPEELAEKKKASDDHADEVKRANEAQGHANSLASAEQVAAEKAVNTVADKASAAPAVAKSVEVKVVEAKPAEVSAAKPQG